AVAERGARHRHAGGRTGDPPRGIHRRRPPLGRGRPRGGPDRRANPSRRDGAVRRPMRPDPIAELADRYPDLAPCLPAVEAASAALAASLNGGGQILVCGNGGSAADSEHIVGELMKGFRSERRLTPGERDRLEREWGEAGAYL